MRESIVQREKAGSSVSIPALKQPTRGFGLDLLNASPAAATQAQPINKPITHDISRISFRRPQAKLTIGQPGDVYEQEADSVAQQVMQRMALSGNRQSIQRQEAPEEEEELQMKPLEISTLQRQEAPEEEEELQMKPLDINTLQRQEAPEEEEELQMSPMVQRKGQGGMAATPDLETSINQARGGGQPLGDNIRKPMEQAFGADFGGVKVHTDSRSDQLNQSIQARAFTTGQDVFFRQGEYNPGSRGGQELLAHELTHVVQQNGGARTLQRTFDEGRSLGNSKDKEFNSISPPREGEGIYFRAMTVNEYEQLCNQGVFTIEQSYQGISPSFDYAKKYFGANKSHHLVEFTVHTGINLKDEFNYAGTGEKAEAGVMSLGLGSKATPVRSGEGALGGEYFMYCLKARAIKWRLIKYIGLRPPKVSRG